MAHVERTGIAHKRPSYEEWLENALIDNENTPTRTKSQELPAGDIGLIPADYIVRAVKEHHAGTKKTVSGLRAPGYTVVGDLHLENYPIPFPVFFEKCRFKGNLHVWAVKASTLSLAGSIVEGGIDMRGSHIDGPLILRDGFTALGPVIARDMKIAGQADFTGASFQYDGVSPNHYSEAAAGDAFGFSRSSCNALYWRNLATRPKANVTFRDAHTKSLIHDLNLDPPLRSWPEPGHLILDGFKYDRIERCAPERAIAWLELQRDFTPSSYATLAHALEKDNLRHDSEIVLARFKRQEIRNTRNPLKRLIFFCIYSLIGYGLSPQRALLVVVVLFGLHAGLVRTAQSMHAMRPAVNDMLLEPCFYGPGRECIKNVSTWQKISLAGGHVRYVPGDYPALNPFEFSLESFIPIFGLKQHTYWEPVSDAVNVVLSGVAALGIFLGGLFVGAISGLLTPRPSKGSD